MSHSDPAMSKIYNIFYIIENGDDQVFPVEIASKETVYGLKKQITKEASDALASIEAYTLKLYHISEFMYDLDHVAKAQKAKRKPQLPFELDNALELTEVFKGTPPKDIIHIIVRCPLEVPARPSSVFRGLLNKSTMPDGLYPRSKIVRNLYDRLEEYRFVFVRGPPGSGKTSLAMLLYGYIARNHPESKVCFLPRYRDEPKEGLIPEYYDYLRSQGWRNKPNRVLIIDEAQRSYWDYAFCYGMPGRDLLDDNVIFRVHEDQHIDLDPGKRTPWIGLLLTREEMEGVVEKSFPDHHFGDSLLKYVYSLTLGHVGACCDALRVIQNSEPYRTHNDEYSHDDFIRNYPEMSTFLEKLSKDGGPFTRGLPTQADLKDPNKSFVHNLRDVLQEPSRTVLVARSVDQPDSGHPLRLCIEQGWLFNRRTDWGKVEYGFASRLHELYTEWLFNSVQGS